MSPTPPDPHADPLIGATVGNYLILQRIAAGGMGVVYLAQHTKLEREVVVKILAESLVEDDQAVARFEREAKGLSQLDHPNIVTIHDYGRERLRTYIVMEFIKGETLSRRLKRQGRLSFKEYYPILLQLLDALAVAHKRGLVHRDIKPSNLMLTERRGRNDYLKVLDFGLVRLTDSSVEITKNKNLVGTVAYIAPEVIAGEKAEPVSDIYAVGVLSYYVLTGSKPFVGEDDLAVLFQHMSRDAKPLRDMLPAGHEVPDELIALIERCMSKEPADRPADARQMLAELGEDLSMPSMPGVSGEWTPAHPQEPSGPLVDISAMADSAGSTAERSDSSINALSDKVAQLSSQLNARQNNTTIGVVVVIVVVLLLAGLFLWKSSGPERPAANPTAELSAVLDTVEQLTREKKFGQAEALLARVDSQVARDPALLTRAAELEDLTIMGRLSVTASQAEKRGDRDAALTAYKSLLDRDPSDEDALAGLARLSAPVEETEPSVEKGILHVRSTPTGNVFVDDRPMGPSPMSQRISPGAHKVEVRARDYLPYETVVVVTEGQEVSIEPSLEEDAKTSKISKATRSARPAKRTQHEAPKPPRRTNTTPVKVEPAEQPPAAVPPPSKPEPVATKTTTPTHPEPAPTPVERVRPIAAPHLPAIAWIRNVQNLKSVLQSIEQEVITRNDFDPKDVRNTSVLLFKEINRDLAPGANIPLHPPKVYKLIAERVRDGKSRGSTAELLVSRYQAGKL